MKVLLLAFCFLVVAMTAQAGRLYTIAPNMISDTTSTAVTAPSIEFKTFWGQVVCSSGACTQTQEIYGDVDGDGANGVLLCTITLSGTTRSQDVCASSTAIYMYYYVTTTNTTGTGARGDTYAIY